MNLVNALAGRLDPPRNADPETTRHVLELLNMVREAAGEPPVTLAEAVAEQEAAIGTGELDRIIAEARAKAAIEEATLTAEPPSEPAIRQVPDRLPQPKRYPRLVPHVTRKRGPVGLIEYAQEDDWDDD